MKPHQIKCSRFDKNNISSVIVNQLKLILYSEEIICSLFNKLLTLFLLTITYRYLQNLEAKSQNVYIWYHMVSYEFHKGKDHCCNASKLHGIYYEPFDFIGRGSHNTATCLFSRESEEISWVVSWFEGKFEWHVFLSIVAPCVFLHAVNHKRDFRA